jgi:type VI secretion system secreted protein VgrG
MTNVYKYSTLKTSVAMAVLLLVPALAFAQVGLGTAASYTVLAGSAITSSGLTSIRGDVGLSPGTTITGLPAGQPSPGAIHAGDATAAQAQADVATAYNFLVGMPCTSPMTGVELGGKTLVPGVYCFDAAAGLTGALNLDAQGDSAAVFVFQMGSTLTVAAASSVVLSNGAQASHVWWQVGSSATLAAASAMQGNVVAHVSITLAAGAGVTGRLLAQGGAVTMIANNLVGPGGAATPTARTTWSKVKAQYR